MTNNEIITLNSDDINQKVNKIVNAIDLLDTTIDTIQKKITSINKVYMEFEFNKSLSLNKTNSYLRFQVKLLNNEKKYYNTIKKNILEKLAREVYEIGEFTLMILISMEELDIKQKEDKLNIIKKIEKIKKIDFNNIDCQNLIKLINSTIKNLGLINNFLNLIQNYINTMNTKAKEDNLHCNNFEISVLNKKNHILLEYNKYCEQLKEIIEYFLRCSNSITTQLDKQELLNFFIKNNKSDQ